MTTITKRTPADENHQVVTVEGSKCRKFMKSPCPDCPWRKDAVGIFPAEAFRISAHTSYDMNQHSFGCHSSGTKQPKNCAGFLLKGSYHNLGVRLRLMKGDYDLSKVSSSGHELFENYKEMAVANGVSPDDERLALSRTD
ncbi:hypothetical protein KO527_05315 [Pseudoalteromonas sp. C2R02]|uniref:DUF6283 family protein n=1 Tax=Pseudoalteromonas sp. C2R02 TaxID=2841565 RepID=UPI001C09FBDE|nr:DUF6283 family protein [Pseudoalteromonas sp. C2R02]MBU2968767.1 hypothetical protein [Pseudoalteromonas sp. C2R02]